VLLPEHCCPRDGDDWDESCPVGVVAAVDGGGSRSSDGVPAAVVDGDCESHLSAAEEEVIFNFVFVFADIFARIVRFVAKSPKVSQNHPKVSQNLPKCRQIENALQRDARPRQVAHDKM
jgi:hypothetical protein